MKPKAIKFDIEEELKTIEASQCAACRIGTTHQVNNPCYPKVGYAPMAYCPTCDHMWNTAWFDTCPVCEE